MRTIAYSFPVALCLLGAAFPIGAQSHTECSNPALSFGDIGLPAAVSDTVAFDEYVTVAEVEVATTIAHTFIGDLTVQVTSPALVTVTLHAEGGGADADIVAFWNDAGAPNGPPYDCICAMQPSGPGSMGDLALGGAIGTWTLVCSDAFPASDAGTLASWCVTATGVYPSATACSAPGTEFGLTGLPASISETLAVAEDLVIDDVEVSTAIAHVWIGDVVLAVSTPTGSSLSLKALDASDADDLDVTWSDRGAAYPGVSLLCGCGVIPAGPGSFADLAGETARGEWILNCADDYAATSAGTLEEWCVRVFGARRPSVEECSLPGTAFGDAGLPSAIQDTIEIAAERAVDDVEVTTVLTHAFLGDLTLAVTSPAATAVTLFAASGGDADDIAVIWSALGKPHAPPFDCACFAQPSGPGLLADFAGESPAGTWTLDCEDSFADSGGGTLDGWCVAILTLPALELCAAPALDFGAPGLPDFAASALSVPAGAPIADLEVRTEIPHTFSGDLVVAIESPAGTMVTLHDDATIADPDIRVTWSDAGRAYGAPYACACTMSPAGPGTLADLAGSPPAGEWTLMCEDFFPASDAGTLDVWCLRFLAETTALAPKFLRGDVNGNGDVSALADALYFLTWAFAAGPAPPCLDAADADGDNDASALVDALFLLAWQFALGPQPPAPGTKACGADDDLDAALDCAAPAIYCNP